MIATKTKMVCYLDEIASNDDVEVQERPYSQRIIKSLKQCTINLLFLVHDGDEPTRREKMNCEDKSFRRKAIPTEIENLEVLKSFKVIPKPSKTKPLYTKFIFEQRRNEQGVVKRIKLT